MAGGGGGGGGVRGALYAESTDCEREPESTTISTIGGLGPFCTFTTDGSTECCVGVRGDESATESRETSETVGEVSMVREG
jgi:hypothetical protein